MIEFEYKGKLYYTENLNKKLKRLKISKDDIKITNENFIEQKSNTNNDEYMNIPFVYIYDKCKNNIIEIIWNKHINEFSIDYLINKPYFLWDENTKTGIKDYTEEYIKSNFYILKDKPEYPLDIENITKNFNI